MNHTKQDFCPLCGNLKLSQFKPENYSNCENCKIVFQNPVPSENELAKLYENYYAFTDAKANVGYKNYDENRSPTIFDKNYLPWIEKYVKNMNAIFLDFGCGTGNLSIALKNKGFKNAEGCEFATDAFPPLREKNITCFECKDLEKQTKKYSAITMIDVVEHLREPRKDLEIVYKSMENNGFLFIETINIDDFMVQYFYKERWIGIAPAHTFLWGITSLKKALSRSGFKIIDIKIYKISGSVIKRMAIFTLSFFFKKYKEKYENSLYQFTFGDGVRIVAQK